MQPRIRMVVPAGQATGTCDAKWQQFVQASTASGTTDPTAIKKAFVTQNPDCAAWLVVTVPATPPVVQQPAVVVPVVPTGTVATAAQSDPGASWGIVAIASVLGLAAGVALGRSLRR